MKEFLQAVRTALFALLLTSCITLIDGKKTDVTLMGQNTEPVNIRTAQHTYVGQMLPTTIEVKKRDLKQPISVESDSYRYAPVIPDRKVNGWSIAQILLPWGYAGLIVDAATHSLYKARSDAYPLAFVAKDDTVSTLPLFTTSDYVPPVHRHRDHFQRHELAISAGLGNVATMAYDELHEDLLCDKYHLNNSYETVNQPHIALGSTYYYHFTDRLAFGATFGVNMRRQSMDNEAFRERMNGYWSTYADHWYYWGHYRDDFYYRTDNTPLRMGTIRHTQLYLMPTLKTTWAYFRSTSLYSRLSIGAAYRHLQFTGTFGDSPTRIDRSGWQMVGQAVPLGLDMGTGSVHGFVELGLGCEGFLNAGLSVRF